jgi:hypothetical protein
MNSNATFAVNPSIPSPIWKNINEIPTSAHRLGRRPKTGMFKATSAPLDCPERRKSDSFD